MKDANGEVATKEFDGYALRYDAALAEGIAVSGENKDYFARRRVEWLGARLGELGVLPERVLDFGCGTGGATPFLLMLPGVKQVVGVDVSSESIAVARRLFSSSRARFEVLEDAQAMEPCDLAFCNGVFHHIAPAARSEALGYLYRGLRPGGLFALWENNPLNPGTRIVMSRIPFDRNAITLTARETRALVNSAGFVVLRTDFLFIFPRLLGYLRVLEPALSRLPLGAQYQVLCRRP